MRLAQKMIVGAVTTGESLDLGEFAAIDLKKARRFFEVRFWGAVTAAKYAAKRIKSTGSIILTNGIIGLRPQRGWVIAAGICGAVETVTRGLAIELAPVRVNLVRAGIVRTELWRNMNEPDRPLPESGSLRILRKPISISCANASVPEP